MAREEENVKKQHQEITKLAQQNHLSMMHSRYVNERISKDQLNPNDISDTQE